MTIWQFSEHFQLIFENSNVNNDKQLKQTEAANFFSVNFSELSNFSSSSFWEKQVWNQKFVLLTATVGHSYYTSKTFSNVELFFIFSQTFLELIFSTKIENNVVETISCFVYQLSKKYCVNEHYVSEHLKYCSQINEFWVNKNA